MARRYLVDPLPPPGSAALPESVGHHLRDALRVRVGDDLVLFDGHEAECRAVVTAVGREVRVDAGPAQRVLREPAIHLHLAIALPKGPRADWLFEHGTEVGVGTFHPVLAARSAARYPDTRIERWRRIAAAASGQCDRSTVPEIRPARPLQDLLADPTPPAARFLASADAPPLEAAPGAAILLVGPEGGFTDDEVQAAEAAGFLRRGLGPLTLRTETAALAGAVLLLRPHGTG